MAIRLHTYAMSPHAGKVPCFPLSEQLDFECFHGDPLRVERDRPDFSGFPGSHPPGWPEFAAGAASSSAPG